ncbi:sensor domain-containing diguanylate cyclase [Ruminococcus albus]|uniref:Diguanylate cyclase (GGDEF) domain protein n=1 Tax=Ruminococcus albus 8 TaxID=246199 RepID=E9SC24_RUMAL|nr:sensor domain-containing diguanylate cyclase [Ruminococcus albus]EGC03216.1 diguanylate cyclase (GGDEF) domain protein [Ruminococcus albus 8]MCC3351964.1 sensor domain-containing diguanylate cyclase [Ruminococcus albus 8]
MVNNSHRRGHIKAVHKIQTAMMLGFAILVMAAVVAVMVLSVNKTDTVLKNKVVSMTSSLSVQMKLNLESYMNRMETIATLAFGEEESYTYDATSPDNDEYDAINTEKVISDKLFNLCIMENFVDYGIVYRNNRTVGKISNGSMSLFGEHMFEDLSAMITNQRLHDGWFTGYEGDFRRIYYVKQVHKNAVLFISFYANELSGVFDNPETLAGMQIELVDGNYNTLYSKNGNEVGTPLKSEIRERIEGHDSATAMDNDYLVSVNKCNDWYVVCYIPTQQILAEKNVMKRYIYMVGVIAMVLAATLGMYLSWLLTKPVKAMVSELDNKASTDRLTGILNKLTFEELAGTTLQNSLDSERRAMVILDIDDFKRVNDTLGHAAGDKLLAGTGGVLRQVFSDDDYLGRIGGDEFCVLVNTASKDDDEFIAHIKERCEALNKAFHDNSTAAEYGYQVTASIGAALYPKDGKSFEELYSACDKAMYRAKKSGKDGFTFYDGESGDAE